MISLIVCLLVGAMLGVALTSLLVIASDADDRMDELIRSRKDGADTEDNGCH